MELTAQQADDILNVSRPHLEKLLDEGKLPWRIFRESPRRGDDLMVSKQTDDKARGKVLEQLTAEASELGMGNG